MTTRIATGHDLPGRSSWLHSGPNLQVFDPSPLLVSTSETMMTKDEHDADGRSVGHCHIHPGAGAMSGADGPPVDLDRFDLRGPKTSRPSPDVRTPGPGRPRGHEAPRNASLGKCGFFNWKDLIYTLTGA